MISKLIHLGRESVIYGLGNSLNRVIPLAALPLFTQYLSPGEFGVIAILGVIGVIYRSVFGLGLGVSTGIVYFKPHKENQDQATIGTSFLILACSGAGLMALTFAFADEISVVAFRETTWGVLILVYAASIAIQIMTQPFLLELQYRNQAVKFVLVSTGSAFIGVAAMVMLIAGAGRGLQGWVEGGLIGNLSAFILSCMVLGRSLHVTFDVDSAKELIKFGAPIIPSFACLFVIQYSGTYMLQWFEEFDQIGIYGIGYNIGMALGLATSAFTTAWYPFFQSYVSKQEEARPIFSHILTLYTFGFGMLCLLFFLLAKPTVYLLTEARYHSAYRVVGMIALGQFCLGMWSVLLPGMYFAKETHFVTLVQGAAGAVVVVLNLLLIPAFGTEGAAMSLALGSVGMVGLQELLNRIRNYRVASYRWHRPRLLLGVLTVLIVLQVVATRALPITGEILAGLMTLGGYMWFSWLLLSCEEKQEILRLARNRIQKR